MPQPLIIRLGPHWTKFSRPRDDLTLLGTIQQHAAIGALAQRPDGRYVQLNGDVEQALNTSRVEKAIRSSRQRPGGDAGGSFRGGPAPRHFESAEPSYQVPQPPKGPVVVSIKKRRLPVTQSG